MAKETLNTKQELFCKLYCGPREFFGNATQSYIEAYQPKQTAKNWYEAARTSASRLLANVSIAARVSELLKAHGLDDSLIDAELSFLVRQNTDLGAKMRAIQEYNKLKGRYKTQEVVHEGLSLKALYEASSVATRD